MEHHSECHNYSVCWYCCTMMSNNRLCVVWPGNEAIFSLDVLETSVSMTSIIAPRPNQTQRG